jgi:hypothetical protein
MGMGELILISESDGQTCKSFVPFDGVIIRNLSLGKGTKFLVWLSMNDYCESEL